MKHTNITNEITGEYYKRPFWDFSLKMERLAAIEPGLIQDKDVILSMEDADFELYIVGRQAAKNEADRVALVAERQAMEAKAKAAQDALDAQKAQADAIEAARKQERDLAAKNLLIAQQQLVNERKESADRKVREEAEAEDRRVREVAQKVQQEKDEATRKVQAEADAKAAHEASVAAKAADAEYQYWLVSIGYTPENSGAFKFITTGEDGEQIVEAYRHVGIFKKVYAKD